MRAGRGEASRSRAAERKGLALIWALPHPLALVPAETEGEDRSQRSRPSFPSEFPFEFPREFTRGFTGEATRAGGGAPRECSGAGIARSVTPGFSTR